jgi:hypothetical protein
MLELNACFPGTFRTPGKLPDFHIPDIFTIYYKPQGRLYFMKTLSAGGARINVQKVEFFVVDYPEDVGVSADE